MDRKDEKKALRKQIKEKIQKLSPEYCQEADEKIFKHLVFLEEFQKADTIFCYVGTEREINTKPILEHILSGGKRLGVPKCLTFGVMEVREIRSLSDLVPGAYGILEPKETCPLISPEEISFACVPCLTCTKDGVRLGYGGGFYDRYLSNMNCKKAVLCRKALMTEYIPTEEQDISVDYVISDESPRWIL